MPSDLSEPAVDSLLPTTLSSRAVRQQLESWRAAGLSHLPRMPFPENIVAALPLTTHHSPLLPAMPAAKAVPSKSLFEDPRAAPSEQASGAPVGPLSREERVSRLRVLADQVSQCRRCTILAETRTQTVFGVGNPQAKILFIGEAPGADEDRQGEPFVGRAGKLLNDIIAACRLKREEVYICNILKCRPPENRTPLPDECASCREYLDAQLQTVAPEYIVCWGTVAAQNLLGTAQTIGKLRGRFFKYGRAKVLCTYHPSYLLRTQSAKKDTWDDMKFLFADMGVDLTARS